MHQSSEVPIIHCDPVTNSLPKNPSVYGITQNDVSHKIGCDHHVYRNSVSTRAEFSKVLKSLLSMAEQERPDSSCYSNHNLDELRTDLRILIGISGVLAERVENLASFSKQHDLFELMRLLREKTVIAFEREKEIYELRHLLKECEFNLDLAKKGLHHQNVILKELICKEDPQSVAESSLPVDSESLKIMTADEFVNQASAEPGEDNAVIQSDSSILSTVDHCIRKEFDVTAPGFNGESSFDMKVCSGTNQEILRVSSSDATGVLNHFDGSSKQEGTNHHVSSFQCNQCPYITSKLRILKKHINVKHQKLGFNCDLCLYGGSSKRKLRRHRLNAHTSSGGIKEYGADHIKEHDTSGPEPSIGLHPGSNDSDNPEIMIEDSVQKFEALQISGHCKNESLLDLPDVALDIEFMWGNAMRNDLLKE